MFRRGSSRKKREKERKRERGGGEGREREKGRGSGRKEVNVLNEYRKMLLTFKYPRLANLHTVYFFLWRELPPNLATVDGPHRHSIKVNLYPFTMHSATMDANKSRFPLHLINSPSLAMPEHPRGIPEHPRASQSICGGSQGFLEVEYRIWWRRLEGKEHRG